MSPCIARLRHARIKPLLLLPLTLAAYATAASPALAAPQPFFAADSPSDKNPDPRVADAAFEITSASATLDPDAGNVSVVLNTAASIAAKNVAISITFGYIAANGLCSPPVEDGSTAPPDTRKILNIVSGNVPTAPTPQFTFWTVVNADGSAAGTFTPGSRSTITTGADDPSLKGLSFECARIELQALVENEDAILADAIQLAPGTSATTPTPVPTAPGTPKVISTNDPDADGDGVPDASDACPKVAGAAKNGCAAVSSKNEFRLGARRVVFDRLTKRSATAKACPAKAAAIVTAKGKRLGKTVVTVETHGVYCYVKGVVKLKKRSSKVRITVKATGMTGLAKTLKR